MTAWREPRTLLIGLFVLAFASGDVGDLDLADGGAGATDQLAPTSRGGRARGHLVRGTEPVPAGSPLAGQVATE